MSEVDLYDAEQYEKYVTKNQCCLENFSNGIWTCCDEGDGECSASGHIVYLPDWIMQTCKERDSALMSEWDSTWASASMESCCESFYEHDKKCGLGDSDLFYPNPETSECLLKPLSEFELWENDVYENLHDCCREQFPNAITSCCDGHAGGCVLSGTTMWLPDWYNSHCYEKVSWYEMRF